MKLEDVLLGKDGTKLCETCEIMCNRMLKAQCLKLLDMLKEPCKDHRCSGIVGALQQLLRWGVQ